MDNESFEFMFNPSRDDDNITVQEYAEAFANGIAQLVKQGDLNGITYLENIATQGRYAVETVIAAEAERRIIAARLASGG